MAGSYAYTPEMQREAEKNVFVTLPRIEKAYNEEISKANNDFYFIKDGVPSEFPVIHWNISYSGGLIIDTFKRILRECTTKFILAVEEYSMYTVLHISDSRGSYHPDAFSTHLNGSILLQNYMQYWGHKPRYTDIKNTDVEQIYTDIKNTDVEQIPREMNFTPGMFYKHFKRETVDQNSMMYIYKIVCNAVHTETGEDLIIYQAAYGDYTIYARPKTMFEEKVDKEKYPNIKQEYRFEPYYFDLKENK